MGKQFRFWFPHWNQTSTPPPSTAQPSSSSSSSLGVPTPTSIPIRSESTSPSRSPSPSPLPGSPSARSSDQSLLERRPRQQQRRSSSSSTGRPPQPSSPSASLSNGAFQARQTQESATPQSQTREDLESKTKIKQVQEKATTYAEPIAANAHPSILLQIEEESEVVLEHQHMPVEEKHERVSEENAMEIDITEEINPSEQNSEPIAEAIQDNRPKVDSESHEVLPETINSSELESMNGISGKAETELMPDAPQASPNTAGYNFHREIKGDSGFEENMNSENSEDHVWNERTRRSICLAGKNHGAYMHIGLVHEELKISVQKINNVGEQKEESKEESHVTKDVPSRRSINCCVQSINNSILHESSYSQDDPGVHLVFSRKPNVHPVDEIPNTALTQTIMINQETNDKGVAPKELFHDHNELSIKSDIASCIYPYDIVWKNTTADQDRGIKKSTYVIPD